MHSLTLKVECRPPSFTKRLMVCDPADQPFMLKITLKQDFAWIWCTAQDV
jgi:hypothetical protein